MDPILQELLKEGGRTVLATTLGACMTKLLSANKKKKLTPKEEAQVQKTAERMIQTATMDDVRQFSPAYQRLSGCIKKRVAKKVGRKVVIKCGPVKSVGLRRAGVETAGARPPQKKSPAKKR